MSIYIFRIPNLDFSIILDNPGIANTIKISFQICRVHYLMRENSTDVDFEDDNSLCGEFEVADEHWVKGTGVLSIITRYN